MELLKRMAKVEGRLGGARAAQRARSMDSLDVLDAAAARGRSLPGRGSNQERPDVRSDGPRSLDLDLNKEEGVVGVASFSLQSWEQRRGASDERLGWGPSSSPATALQLLSPRQWRPLSPAAAGVAPDGASRSSSRASSPHQTATTKALSEFIKDTYTAQSGDIASVPGARSQLEEPSSAPTDPPPGLVISAPEEEAAAAHCVQCSADDETGECLRKRGATRDVSPDEDRPVSSASSTTESLGELEDDILHMLTTTSDRAESEAGDELALESDRGAQRTPSSSSALPSSELVRQQQRQYSLGDATRDSVPTVPVS
ncbi:uncharacterized protein LOC113214606 [Frankliniella occidentalis]|uniref:Uncharacterized protein LOC113214606 n=1 Tax=Frankliniella occidentalis TaxID=133901 RepID=A0A6J1T953_FRAOC|nr:uncharacterized protein LOC113214606 [Frankliniella occidentalis]